MKRLFFALLLALPISAQITYKQSNNGHSSGTSIALAFNSNTTAGSLLAVCVSLDDAVHTISSVTDTQGNTFVASDTLTGSANSNMQLWHAVNTSGGADTVTVHLSAGAPGGWALMHEYAGAATSTPVDVTWAASGNNATFDLGSQTTTASGDVVMSCISANGGTYTPSNAFTSREQNLSLDTADKIISPAGSQDVAWTNNTGSQTWVGHAVAYKQAGGSPPPASSQANPAVRATTLTTTLGSGINTVETAVAVATVPANYVRAGTTYRVRAYGTCTSTVNNISTFNVRFGTAGTSADTQIGTVATANGATSGTNVPFYVEFLVTFQSTTVTEVQGMIDNNGITGITTTQTPIVGAPTNTTGLVTTSDRKLSLLYISAGATTTSTFQVADITVEQP